MIEPSPRRTLGWLNSTYLYGRLPLLHSIVISIETALVIMLIAKFNALYARKPILTTMLTNAVLAGIADTVAQSITAYRSRSIALPATHNSSSFLPSDGVELEEMNEKSESMTPMIPSLGIAAPAPFDFERLTRFMAYGFLFAPVQWQWYNRLNRWFPITKASGTVPAMQKVAMDQLMFAPIGLSCFFTFMTVAEGGGRSAVLKKFQDVYVPTLRANYILWPAVQIINFRLMPVQFQIPFVSTIGIGWTAYLSLTNASEDEHLQTQN